MKHHTQDLAILMIQHSLLIHGFSIFYCIVTVLLKHTFRNKMPPF